MKSYMLAKPRTRYVQGAEYGTLDVEVVNGAWMSFKTFDEAFAYLRDELNGDSRYFIFEWVGTEYGRITKE